MSLKIKKNIVHIAVLAAMTGVSSYASADSNIKQWFNDGSVKGSLKSYYFAQAFEGKGKHDSEIWVNGGNIAFATGELNGFKLGGEFQASYVATKDDEDNKTDGSMNAEGVVMSEAYVQYNYGATMFKGGRQHYDSPLVSNSGSRVIKESYEMYQLRNKSLANTELSLGFVTKYQTRTDRTSYGDNPFVDFKDNGTGKPGDFNDIGDNGMWIAQISATPMTAVQYNLQYANVVDEVQALYADAQYTLPTRFKTYIAAQFYNTDWDQSDLDDNNLYGVKVGTNVNKVDLFASYTTTSGDAGETRVFRGVGQNATHQYTATTKTSGAGAFEAGTDAYQLGAAYKFDQLTTKLRFSSFDDPRDNKDLDEWTLNLLYKFGGQFENLVASVDFTVLDYQDNSRDATDLRTRLIYKF